MEEVLGVLQLDQLPGASLGIGLHQNEGLFQPEQVYKFCERIPQLSAHIGRTWMLQFLRGVERLAPVRLVDRLAIDPTPD